jgi:hypothetical protein
VPKYHIGSTSDHIGAIKIAIVNLENKIGRVRGGTHGNRCVRNSTKKGAHIGTLMWDLSFCSAIGRIVLPAWQHCRRTQIQTNMKNAAQTVQQTDRVTGSIGKQ